MSDESYLWYAVKPPLHPDDIFSGFFYIFDTPPRHELFWWFFLWAGLRLQLIFQQPDHSQASLTKSCLISTLIGQWGLFALWTVNCASSLKGKWSQHLGRDRPSHRSRQHRLKASSLAQNTTSLLSSPPAEGSLTVFSQRASLPSTTPSTAFTTTESSRDFKYVCFPLSPPLPSPTW